MKKLLSFTLLSFALLQSCSQHELDIAPQQLATPTGINIESVVKKMQGFFLNDVNAILLKTCDTDPNTHLTTLFYADSKGNIKPIIENFEVRDVRATTNGIFVLTNYESIAFFVKPNLEWIQLEDVGGQRFGKDVFAGEDDNGNIIFTNGAILNTKSLIVDRSGVQKGRLIDEISGNLSLVAYGTGTRAGNASKLQIENNSKPNTGYEVQKMGYYIFDFDDEYMASFRGTNYALVRGGQAYFSVGELGGYYSSVHKVINMKTGKLSNQHVTLLANETLRLDDGSIIAIQKYHVPFGHPDIFSPNIKILSKITLKKSSNGELEPTSVFNTSVYLNPASRNILNFDYNTYVDNILFGSDKYYIVREQNKVSVFNKALEHKGYILNGLSKVNISVVDSLIYYSGIDMNNKPVSGVYNLDTNQNTVLDTNHVFINIQPL